MGGRVLPVVVNPELNAILRTEEVVDLTVGVTVAHPDDTGIGERVVRYGGVAIEYVLNTRDWFRRDGCVRPGSLEARGNRHRES